MLFFGGYKRGRHSEPAGLGPAGQWDAGHRSFSGARSHLKSHKQKGSLEKK